MYVGGDDSQWSMPSHSCLYASARTLTGFLIGSAQVELVRWATALDLLRISAGA